LSLPLPKLQHRRSVRASGTQIASLRHKRANRAGMIDAMSVRRNVVMIGVRGSAVTVRLLASATPCPTS
jgi:hypothetical protein